MYYRFAIILLYLLFLVDQSIAQKSFTDSLKVALLDSPDDTVKVQNLIKLSQNLVGTDNANAIYYGSRAHDLAEKLDYQPGRALALKYIGTGYYYQGKFLETIDYWEQALTVFEKVGDKAGVSNILSNLGGLNQDEGDDNRGLELCLRSLAIAEEINDTLRIATALQNIALIYSKKPATWSKSRDTYLKALRLLEALDDDISVAYVNVNLGEIFYFSEDYHTALFYFNKALKTFEGTAEEPYTLNYIGSAKAKQGAFEEALAIQKEGLALAKRFKAKKDIAKSYLGIAETYRLLGKNRLAITAFHKAQTLVQEAGFKDEMRDTYKGMALLYAELADYRNAFKYQQLLTAIKDTLFITANEKQLDLIHSNAENEKQQGKIDLLTKDQALQAANLQKQKIVRNAFLGGFVIVFIIAFIIFRNYRNKVKTNKLLDKQNEEIQGLLLNILPVEVAQELQHDGHATPRDYESATVLFADFKGFTTISADLKPHELIAELNSYFNEFDDIIEKYGLEKIKTIGDSYMCAGGLPKTNNTHAFDAVRAGLAMQKYIKKKNEKRLANGLVPWELRIGIHTGHVVAGVIGRKKYAYDIWGDAVNIASRMETNGESYKVNISESTRELVKEEFKCIPRGQISVKGAGERTMYFVEEKEEVKKA